MRKIIVASAFVFLAATPAYAEGFMSTLGKSWSCVKSGAKASFNVSVDVMKKGATVVEIGANAAACTAAQGGNSVPFIATLGAISAIKAASPSTIPTGQCKKAITGLVAKPFAEGLSVVIPPGGIKTKLMSLVESEYAKEQLWEAITNIPGVQPYTMQVDCACTAIDGGLSLTDVEEITDAVKQTSDSCSTALDSLGLGFINDLGNKAGDLARAAYAKLSGLYDELINNESDPKPREEVYGEYFGRERNHYADVIGMNPKTDILPYLENAVEGCANYYDGHKHAKSTGYKICNEMAARLVADSQVLGKRLADERHMLELVQKEWPTRFSVHWAWRLPPSKAPNSFPVDPNKGADVLAAKLQLNEKNPYYASLLKTGGELTCNQTKMPKSALWLCDGTGIYSAARQVFVSTKDAASSLQGGEAGMSARLRAELVKVWNDNADFAKLWYLQSWYPQPAMGGLYGCPAGKLKDECVADLRKTFDVVCFAQIRDAVVNASLTTLSMTKPEKGAVATCQDFLKPRISLANALSNKSVSVNPGTVEAKLCVSYQARSPQMETCQRLIREAYEDCAVTAVKAGPQLGGSSNGPFTTCWDKARAGLETSMASKVLALNPPSVNTTPKPTGTPTAPKPGTTIPRP